MKSGNLFRTLKTRGRIWLQYETSVPLWTDITQDTLQSNDDVSDQTPAMQLIFIDDENHLCYYNVVFMRL